MELFQISLIVTVVMVSLVKLSTTQELQDEDTSVYMVVTGRTETTTVFEDEGSGSGSGDDVIEFSTTPIGSTSSFSDAVMRFTSASSNATTDLPTHRVTVTESSGSDVTTGSDEVEMPTDRAISTESSGSDVTTELGESDEMTTTIDQLVTEIVDAVETTYDVTTNPADAEVTSPSLQLGDGSTTEAVNLSPPVAIVVVPSSVVPVCSSVTVSGVNSYSLSSSIVQYTWSVSSTGDVTEIESLLMTVNANDGEASFDLTGSDLSQVGAACTFTLTVTDENELQHSMTFDIEASSDETFSVGISTTIDTLAADRTDTFQLRSVVTFFEGCDSATDVPVQFSWSSNNLDVQSALGITSNSALTIPANTLSSGATTIFTLLVCLGSDSSYCASASQTITTTIPEIQAIISGPSTRLVGVSSGDLTFDGSTSNDPSDLPGDLSYSWSLEKFVDASFVQVTDATGNTIFAELVDATITFNSSLLSAGNVYRCTLTVTKGERAANQTVIIETTDVETIDVSLTVDSNSLHSDDILIAKCSYTTTDVVIVTWSITSIDDSTMVPLNDSALSVPLQRTTSATGSSIAVLTLAGDVLSPGNNYAIKCALTNQTGEDVGLASIDVTVFSKPISCQVSVADYTVLLEITLSTVGCVTSSVFPPLLYAYYYVANDNGDLKQLSLQSADSVVSVVGPRAFEVSNEVTFVAEVCDQVSSCEYFYTTATAHPVVMVTESEFVNFQQTYVTDLASSGDSLSALQNLNSILETVASTESSSAVDSATVAELQVNLLAAALSEADGASNVAVVLVDQINGINTTDLGSSAKEDLADTVTSILSDVTSSSDPISSTTLSSILITTQGLHSQGVDNSKISNVEEQVLKLITRNALTGGVPVEITTTDATYAVKKAAPCGELNVNSATSSSTVDMGDDVCNSYSSWSCGSDTVCLGVSIKTVFYDEGVDYISSSTSTATSLSSPVMKIDLGNDQTEENIVVDGLSSKISLSLPVTSFNADEPYACRYWDDVTDSWSSEGVETVVDSSTGTVQCRTSHLSAFVVVIDDTSSGVTSSSDVTEGNIVNADETTTTTTTTENTTENRQATVPTTFFSNPLYTTIIVVGVLFFLLCGMVFIFFCVLYICQRQQRKAITESQEIILGEIRTRREGRRSRPTTPRGKVTPEPPADDNGNTTKMAAVPPSHEMEDPKIAWI
ncbi:uncharacterized protein [Apostichopus japonicus]|uniref:uncharacterized protein n=1 Tax=Stichopus japonicus TaxID=307972 RepID=UPI003AB21168